MNLPKTNKSNPKKPQGSNHHVNVAKLKPSFSSFLKTSVIASHSRGWKFWHSFVNMGTPFHREKLVRTFILFLQEGICKIKEGLYNKSIYNLDSNLRN